jgi:hypothetical protein
VKLENYAGQSEDIAQYPTAFIYLFLFFGSIGFELRDLSWLDRHPAHFPLIIYW